MPWAWNLADEVDALVLNMDLGLGIVRPKRKITEPLTIDEEAFDEIDQMTYAQMIGEVKSHLDLKNADYADQIVQEITNGHSQ